MDTSALAATVNDAVLVLLPVSGSGLSLLNVVLFAMLVPGATSASTCTVRVKVSLAPAPNVGRVAEIVPPLPAAGVVAVQPAGEDNETNVVPAGSASLSATFAAACGPALATVNVYC